MAITVEINGSDESANVRLADLQINWRRDARSTMQMTTMAGYSPVIGHPVRVLDGATPRLVGSIDEFTTYDAGDKATAWSDCQVTGYEHRLDKRVQAAITYGPEFFTVNSISDIFTLIGGYNPFQNGYPVRVRSDNTLPGTLSASTTYYVINRTSTTLQLSTSSGGSAVNMTDVGVGNHWLVWLAGAVVKDVVDYWGGLEGIADGTIRNGAVVENAYFEWAPIWTRLEQMAALSGYVVKVNGAGEVDFIPSGEFSAPFNITDSSTEVFVGNDRRGLKVRFTREDYANTLYLRINPDSFGPLVVSLTGDGATRFFRLSGAINEYKVIAELLAVDTIGPDDIGIYGVDTGKQWYYTPNGYWIIQDATGTPLSGSFDVTYRPAGYDFRQAQDLTEISARQAIETGSSGNYELVLSDTGIGDTDAGDVAVAAALARRKEVPVEITYQTYTPGLLPGQTQTVTLTLYGISDTFIIESVDAVTVPAGSADSRLRYTVKAISTSKLGNYIDVFRQFLGGGASVSGGGAVGAGTAATSNDHYAVTLTADATISRTVGAAGTILILELTQDGTGGWVATPSSDFEDTDSPFDIWPSASARTTLTFYSTGTKWRKLPGGSEVKQ